MLTWMSPDTNLHHRHTDKYKRVKSKYHISVYPLIARSETPNQKKGDSLNVSVLKFKYLLNRKCHYSLFIFQIIDMSPCIKIIFYMWIICVLCDISVLLCVTYFVLFNLSAPLHSIKSNKTTFAPLFLSLSFFCHTERNEWMNAASLSWRDRGVWAGRWRKGVRVVWVST